MKISPPRPKQPLPDTLSELNGSEENFPPRAPQTMLRVIFCNIWPLAMPLQVYDSLRRAGFGWGNF